MTDDDLKRVNTKKLAKILDVTPRTILNWRKLGKLPQPEIQSGRLYWTMGQIKDQSIENIIVDSITEWGKHFGVDTSCVNKEQKHPIWQQIFGLLTKLHLDNEELREQMRKNSDNATQARLTD